MVGGRKLLVKLREEPIDRKRCFHFLIKWPPDIFHPLHTSFICKKPGCMYLKFLQLRNSTRVAAYHYLKSKSPLGLHTFNWQISSSQQKQQNLCFNKHSPAILLQIPPGKLFLWKEAFLFLRDTIWPWREIVNILEQVESNFEQNILNINDQNDEDILTQSNCLIYCLNWRSELASRFRYWLPDLHYLHDLSIWHTIQIEQFRNTEQQ